MGKYRCYDCGFETTDRGDFMATSGDGEKHWTIFQCPQCSMSPPKVASPEDNPPWKPPVWGLEETNYGLYVWSENSNGSRHSAPMIPKHQLAGLPASRFRPGEQGSMMDFHRRLVQRGKARSDAFQAAIKGIRDKFPVTLSDAEVREYQAEMDRFREIHNVGPYDTRSEVRMG